MLRISFHIWKRGVELNRFWKGKISVLCSFCIFYFMDQGCRNGFDLEGDDHIYVDIYVDMCMKFFCNIFIVLFTKNRALVSVCVHVIDDCWLTKLRIHE